MIVVQEYERLLGVNVTDGSLLWEAGVPLARRGRRFMYVEAIPLIAGLERHPGETWPRVRGQHTETESATAPRIAFVLGDVTVVRPASLASGVGTVTSAAVRPVLAPARDPRRLRPLPWVADIDLRRRMQVTEHVGWASWAAILVSLDERSSGGGLLETEAEKEVSR